MPLREIRNPAPPATVQRIPVSSFELHRNGPSFFVCGVQSLPACRTGITGWQRGARHGPAETIVRIRAPEERLVLGTATVEADAAAGRAGVLHGFDPSGPNVYGSACTVNRSAGHSAAEYGYMVTEHEGQSQPVNNRQRGGVVRGLRPGRGRGPPLGVSLGAKGHAAGASLPSAFFAGRRFCPAGIA